MVARAGPHESHEISDLTPLLSPRRAGGYRHVYEDASGKHRLKPWVAKINLHPARLHLGRFRSPREAARAVARWYAARFGPEWPAWAGRLHPGCRVEGEAFRLAPNPAGWRLWVWDEGVRMQLPGCPLFPTRAAGWAAYLAHRGALGVLAPAVLTRRLPGSPPPADNSPITRGGLARWPHS